MCDDLEALQLGLMELVKHGNLEAARQSRYLDRVRSSTGLQVLRDISVWWRSQIIETYAPLTTRLLARLDRLAESTDELVSHKDLSPFRQRQVELFLEALCRDPDPRVAAAADFELALLKLKSGKNNEKHVTWWPCEPHRLLEAILTGGEFPPMTENWYSTEVAAALPDLPTVTA